VVKKVLPSQLPFTRKLNLDPSLVFPPLFSEPVFTFRIVLQPICDNNPYGLV